MRKRTEIVIETHRRIQLRRDGPVTGWCPDCAQQVGWVSPEQLAQLLNVSLREIYRRVEAGKFHGQAAPERILICAKSVQQAKADKEEVS